MTGVIEASVSAIVAVLLEVRVRVTSDWIVLSIDHYWYSSYLLLS